MTAAPAPAPAPAPASAAPANIEAPFYPVATHKFIVMSVCTFGLYELYWAYKCWKRIQATSSENLQPFWRAFFGHLYVFSLFARVHEYAKQHRVAAKWNATLLAAIYLFLVLAYRFPGSLGLICFFSFLPAIPVLHTVQAIRRSGRYRERENGQYSLAHILVICLWTGLMVLAIIGHGKT